jgi:hypothetical protein
MKSMTTTVYKFQVVKYAAKKSGKCPVCDKRVTRSRTFESTINPYNKNSDGSVKNFKQVYADVKRLADEWQPDFTHEACA